MFERVCRKERGGRRLARVMRTMEGDDMLNESELDGLLAELTERLALLRQQIGDERATELIDSYRDVAGEVTDVEDEAVGAELVANENALIGHNVEQAREIEGALARIAAGRYGRCVDCAKDIDYARLSACPTCCRCAQCQARHEKMFAVQPHPSL